MDIETLETIENCGKLNFPVDKIISILGIDKPDEFRKSMSDPNSEVAIAYQAGQDRADLDIGMKLFDMAKKGDLKAIMLFEARKRKNQTIKYLKSS